jgi:magnesium-transporting ATPase (P-type)
MLAGALWIFASRMGTPEGLAAARTAVINTVVLVEIAYLFNCRSLHQPCFTRHFFANRWAFLGALAMFGAQLLFTYAPWMNRVFHSAPIDAGAWLQAFAIAAAIFLLVELEKWLRHRDLRRPAKLVP